MANGIPVWSVGEVLASADVNTWFVPLAVYKVNDTSRASNTTITADPDLSIAVPAAGTYTFQLFLDYEGAASPGDLQFKMTSIGSIRYQAYGVNASGGVTDSSICRQGNAVFTLEGSGAGNLNAASFTGFVTATGSGTTTFNWAQNTSSSTATIVHAGSWMMMRRIA